CYYYFPIIHSYYYSTHSTYTTLFRSRFFLRITCVMLVPKSEEVESISADQSEFPGQRIDLIEVQPEHKDIVGESMTTRCRTVMQDRKSTRLNSSHVAISYAVFFLIKK